MTQTFSRKWMKRKSVNEAKLCLFQIFSRNKWKRNLTKKRKFSHSSQENEMRNPSRDPASSIVFVSTFLNMTKKTNFYDFRISELRVWRRIFRYPFRCFSKKFFFRLQYSELFNFKFNKNRCFPPPPHPPPYDLALIVVIGE